MKLSLPSRAILGASALLAISFLSVCPAQAAPQDELIQHSHRLSGMVVALRGEFDEHYRRTTLYRHLIGDAARIQQKVNYLNQISHNPRTAIWFYEATLDDIDEQACHMQDLMSKVDTGRYGQVYGCTIRARDLMSSIMNLVRYMETEVNGLRQPAYQQPHHSHSHSNHNTHSNYGRPASQHPQSGYRSLPTHNNYGSQQRQLTDAERHRLGRAFGSSGHIYHQNQPQRVIRANPNQIVKGLIQIFGN